MTNREFRRHLTEKRLEAIRAEVAAENTAPLAEKKPPATERQFKISRKKA